MSTKPSKWISKPNGVAVRYWAYNGNEVEITIEARPPYCDRGNWIAKVFPVGQLAMDMDAQDGWPRYYFDLERAQLECEAWLKKRGLYLLEKKET